MSTVLETFTSLLETAAKLQSKDGSMPPGHNGSYNDPETPSRTTSHYLCAFTRAWHLTNDEKFRVLAEKCLAYLLRQSSIDKFTLTHRTKKGKDSCNGLIGPAWNIEALLYASESLGSKEARQLAISIYKAHSFDRNLKAWNRIEPNGEILPTDRAFNHQLWFAACSSPLLKDPTVDTYNISEFLKATSSNWKTQENGLIYHHILTGKGVAKETLKRLLKRKYRRYMTDKEIGYQSFNLYAFSMLKEQKIDLPNKCEDRIKKAITFLESERYSKRISNSEYGFPYNPPGFEIPYILESYSEKNKHNTASRWLKRQLNHSYCDESKLLTKGTPDKNTANARIYELARCSDKFFELPV